MITIIENESKLEGRIEGKIEGRIEGKIEGEQLKAVSSAIKMINKNFDNETIIEIIGLTNEQVEKLRKMLMDNTDLPGYEAIKYLSL